MAQPKVFELGGDAVASRVIEEDAETYFGKADAAGKCIIALPVVPGQGQVLKVERTAVFSDSVAVPKALRYIDREDPRNFRGGSDDATLDESDENHPILVKAGHQLIVVFSGADVGADCYATFQWRVERSAGGGA